MRSILFSQVLLHIGIFLAIQFLFTFFYDLQWYRNDRNDLNEESVQTTQNILNDNNETQLQHLRDGSSVWCTGSNKSERICKFRNLCYHPIHQEYIFFHGSKSVQDGIPQDRSIPLLDISSIDDHNTQYFDFVDFPASALDLFQNITVYNGVSFIFHRFNAENIMHVFHDDLLPLFHTMKHYTNAGPYPIDLSSRLVFMEGWDAGPYFELYELFSNKKPLLKKDITQSKNLKCFRHAVVGISKFTTWYQYGFKTPQSPLPNIKVTGQVIRGFIDFLRHRLNINKMESNTSDVPYIVFSLRKYNRLVLNEDELSLAMTKSFNKRVIHVSMKTHTLKQLIQITSKASALVGMHGSALVMAMFLCPGALLIEMFPFGINPDNYLPYKTLAKLPGMELIYSPWRNTIQENTVTHPNDAPEFGGIKHLSIEDQELIEQTIEVSPHICCSDPFWLYRIYQDTIVDEGFFLQNMDNAFRRSQELIAKGFETKHSTLNPSNVLNLTCSKSTAVNAEPTLSVSWKRPINAMYLKDKSIKYEVWIQKAGRDDYEAYILPFTEYVFRDNVEANSHYRVWARCIAGEALGSFGPMANCFDE